MTARKFVADLRGGVALTFALSTPAIMGATALAVDYSSFSNTKVHMQELTDSAALAGARELRLGSAAQANALTVAQNYVSGNAISVTTAPISFSGSLAADNAGVTVNLSAAVPTYIAKTLGVLNTTVSTHATARLTSGPPICMIGLDTNSNWTVSLDNSARMLANGCSVFVNSSKPNGLAAKSGSYLQSSFTCTVGGFFGSGANYSPSPQTGCPTTPDPLKSRPQPTVGACDPAKQNISVSSGTVTLYPGVYCGGLKVSGGAMVNLSAGEYYIKNGDLVVSNGGTLTGSYVGFYFAGGSTFTFDPTSNLDLGAPKSGPLTSMLFWQQPVNGQQTFKIDSNHATRLLGTIYLPNGNLQFGGSAPVAQNSPFTVIVANSVSLSGGPTMFLNTNYNGTDVPVPNGLGSQSGSIALSN